jgi:hypothetical protein
VRNKFGTSERQGREKQMLQMKHTDDKFDNEADLPQCQQAIEALLE